jgi:aminopeptidase-like protein
MKTEGKNIEMYYGDFGVQLPITITNVLETDTIKFEIYDINNNVIIEKDLPYENEKWIFELTEDESKKLEIRDYLYSIKQYRDGTLQNTIAKWFIFRVK